MSAADLKVPASDPARQHLRNEWSRRLPSVENFVYTFNATIETATRNPANRLSTSRSQRADGPLAIDYALITVKPNVSGENAVMTLAGISAKERGGGRVRHNAQSHDRPRPAPASTRGQNAPPSIPGALRSSRERHPTTSRSSLCAHYLKQANTELQLNESERTRKHTKEHEKM